ncbi:MAG: hypothetical protein ACYCOY_00845 [Metallibacterium sp.]
MKKAFVLSCTMLLAGCASYYVAPTEGPKATVTFSAAGMDLGAAILVQNFENDSCASSKNGTRLATFTTTAIQGKGDPHDGIARAMPAGRPAVITFFYNDWSSGYMDASCTITQAFTPVIGGRYLVHFIKSGLICRVLVTRQDGKDPTAVTNLHQVKPACINGTTG